MKFNIFVCLLVISFFLVGCGSVKELNQNVHNSLVLHQKLFKDPEFRSFVKRHLAKTSDLLISRKEDSLESETNLLLFTEYLENLRSNGKTPINFDEVHLALSTKFKATLEKIKNDEKSIIDSYKKFDEVFENLVKTQYDFAYGSFPYYLQNGIFYSQKAKEAANALRMLSDEQKEKITKEIDKAQKYATIVSDYLQEQEKLKERSAITEINELLILIKKLIEEKKGG